MLIGEVERDRRSEHRTSVFADHFLHRRFRPVGREPAADRPAAAQACVAKHATAEAGEPNPCVNIGLGPTAWYSFTPQVTAIYQADTLAYLNESSLDFRDSDRRDDIRTSLAIEYQRPIGIRWQVGAAHGTEVGERDPRQGEGRKALRQRPEHLHAGGRAEVDRLYARWAELEAKQE